MKKFYSLIFILLLSASAFAHEYWLEPDKFFLAPNEKTFVHIYVGDGLVKDREEREYLSEKTSLFRFFSVDKTLDLKPSTAERAKPIFSFSAEKSGGFLLALERNWSFIKLGAMEFEEYLREDGMEYIIAERAKLGESQKEGRERYSRFLKTLLQVGDKKDNAFKKNAGLKLEITPLENPAFKKQGDNLKLQVLFDGKPLTGKTIFADNPKSETQKMTTDKNGQITMKIDQNGLWLVRIVFMQRCKNDCADADWESFWGAFSFGVK